MKIGFAKDIHPLIKSDKPLIIGGVKLNSTWSIKATSDGDVVLHAITSAILGALGLKTLGEYFPESETINHARNSVDFLKFALQQMENAELSIHSLDLCIVCEQIMLKDHLPAIRDALMDFLKIDTVGIKCTRFEQSNNAMIECYCSLILNK